jgi:hypothetical protein
VDTGAWIAFFRTGAPAVIADDLRRDLVVTHLYVLAEIRLGSGVPRLATQLLEQLPRTAQALDHEVFDSIDRWRTRGVGWVDMHLLVAADRDGLAIRSPDGDIRREGRRILGSGRILGGA